MIRTVSLVLLSLLLTACVTFSVQQLDLRNLLVQGQAALALQELESQHVSGRDRSLYELNKGMLLRLAGDYAQSNVLLEAAKQRMKSLSATSITENLAAFLINDATRSYIGQPHEHLLLHAYKALNYIALNDISGARVEMLQADAKMRNWTASKDLEGVKASAFVRYLSGLVYELNREWSDALIAYRKAYKVYTEKSLSIPLYLQKDLLRLTSYQGLDNEHKDLLAEFGEIDWPTMSELQRQSEVIVVYHQGVVSAMREHSIYSYSNQLKNQIKISVPYYLPISQQPYAVRVSIGKQQGTTLLSENIEQLVRDNLAARMPAITLRTVARAVVKKQTADKARKDNALAGFLADITAIVTESADTRSWNTLPASIQIARFAVPPGEHQLQVYNSHAYLGRTDFQRQFTLAAGEKQVFAVHSNAVELMPPTVSPPLTYIESTPAPIRQ